MGTFLLDVRYGLRMLIRNPGFSAVAVITLALGIGANAAIFSVVNAVLLRPLPYGDPDRLVLVQENNLSKGWEGFAVSPANFADWREQGGLFESMTAFRGVDFTLTGAGEPERVAGLKASASVVTLLGLQPALGRGFLEDEDRPGGARVALLGHALWQRRFAGNRDVVGATVLLNGEAHRVVGVMPPEFRLANAEILVPMAFTPGELETRGSHFLFVLARRAPGVTLEAARAGMKALAARLEALHPDTNKGWGVVVADLRERVVGDVRPALLVLFGAVGFVLLIACANVANLLLARAGSRRREFAVRAALGAGRGRVVRQLLTESLMLSLLGAGVGLLLAVWGIDLLLSISPGAIPRSAGVGVDGVVLLFTLGASVLTSLLFGVVPALQTAHAGVHEALREGGRSGATGVRRIVRGALVVSEMALAVVLLIGAGLMIKSFSKVAAVNPGFHPEGALTLEVALPPAKYPDAGQRVAFFDALLERLRALPGASVVAAGTPLPMGGDDLIYSFEIEGQAAADPSQAPSANYYMVSADYFRAMGIPLRSGRLFSEQDRAGSPPVAIVDETFARRHFGDASALGHRLRIGNDESVVREIVGVVGAVRHYALVGGPSAAMYEPAAQRAPGQMTLVLRGGARAASLAGPARAAVLALDPEQPVFAVRTLDEVLSGSIADRRLPMLLLGVFAAVALVLAGVGLYGVISWSVTQRTHELGVRMALGARAADILRLVLGQGMTMTLIGVAIGLAASFGLTRLVSRLLFGVSPTDPMVFAALPLALAAVAFLASWVPARRATRVDPCVALRQE